MSASFSGPRFEPDDAAPLYADGRRRREPAPEVLRVVERLPDERRADDLAVLHDQAAVRLRREDDLGDRGHDQRIDDAGQDRQDGEDRGARGGAAS